MIKSFPYPIKLSQTWTPDFAKTHTSQLIKAILDGNNELSRDLIDQGLNLNKSDYEGQTALMTASYKGNVEIAQMLIDAGANVNHMDGRGRTAVFYSTENGNKEVARLLIEKCIDVNICDQDGQSPLFIAARNSNKEILQLLIEKGIDVNKCDQYGQTPLFIAASKGNKEILQLLIEKGIDVNKCDEDGQSPLFTAARNSNKEVLQLLIEKGIDVNKCNIYGQTPLFIASVNSNKEILQLLIEKGIDVNKCDQNGQSPLFIAARNNNREISRLLIENGIDVNKCDQCGQSPLFIAVKIKGEEVAQLLIEKGADVNARDEKGRTPLFYAFTPSTTRMLLVNGADLSIRSNDQETALMHIIKCILKEQYRYRSEDLSLLVNCLQPSLMARDLCGRTAMFYAVMECVTIKEFKGIASTLIDNGAVLDDTDNNGVSVLSYFIERCFVYEILCKDVSEGITFFTEKGIPNSTVFISVLSYLHVILPHLLQLRYYRSQFYDFTPKFLRKIPKNMPGRKELFSHVLAVASKYASFKQLELIQTFKALLYKNKVTNALDVLMALGVNPNSADRQGNTALHYTTLLQFSDESNEDIMKILKALEKNGVRFNVKNHEYETPLHFCLSERTEDPLRVLNPSRRRINRAFVDICEFLLKDGSLLSETTRSGESVYHLIMKLFRRGLSVVEYSHAVTLEFNCHNALKLLQLFSKTAGKLSNVSKKVDNKQNSPLHLWASLSLPSSQSYKSHVAQSFTFQMILDNILKHLISQGVTLNPRNEDEQTPLHLCKTWTAMELLINAGANTSDLDGNGRSALLNVAKEATNQKPIFYHLYSSGYQRCFLPDVKKDEEFFEKCVSLGLDIWGSDNDGESILTIFLELQWYELAKPLIDVIAAKCNSTSVIKELVDAICKDTSTSTTWKSLLTKTLITSSRLSSKINLDDALRHICTNIERLQKQGYSVGFEEERKLDELKDTEEHIAANSSVHVDIARQLLFYGADGNSLCNDFPNLHSLLTATIRPEQVEKIIAWTSHSKKHEEKLKAVSRKQNVENISTYYFHQEPIGHGSFGEVYAGICEKDAREVAIKKIKRSLVNRPQDEREILNLTALADSPQVVTYIFFDDSEKDVVYIVLELMEGHLDDHLANSTFSMSECTMLCTYIVQGLKYLHEYKPVPILHRDLKPENILYKFDPQGKLLLKIADFGLSTPLTTGRTTVLHSKAGTRCWIAPEVISSQPYQHSKSSDVFSCGLLFHYILSKQKHPYSPADCTDKTTEVIDVETQSNMLNYKMEGWDDELSPEAKHLIENMLQRDDRQRPSAADTLRHPFFWSNEKKMNLLQSVGNQQVIACLRPACGPLNALESELENEQPRIIQHGDWTDARYIHTSVIYTNMQTDPRARKKCDTRSVVELVRFIRNSLGHVSEPGRPNHMQKQILDGVFLEEFPDLLMEVYKAVIKHGWNLREEIKKSLEDD